MKSHPETIHHGLQWDLGPVTLMGYWLSVASSRTERLWRALYHRQQGISDWNWKMSLRVSWLG